jgi:hypothetical protein
MLKYAGFGKTTFIAREARKEYAEGREADEKKLF